MGSFAVVILRESTVSKLAAEGLTSTAATDWAKALNTPTNSGPTWAAVVPEPLPYPMRRAISLASSMSRSA
jgi:hypothetical protein